MTEKHDDAKKLRDDLVDERAALVAAMQDETPNSAAWLAARDEVIRKSSEVRYQGNIMRDETGREMGEGTSYTGPLQDATKQRIAQLAAQEEGLLGLNPISDWQQANINLFEDLDPNLSYGDQRTEWDRLWGADREGMLAKQRAEYGDITKKDDDANGKDRFDVNDDWFSNNDNWSWDGSQWVKSGTTSKELETPDGSVDMLAYRPGTNAYWKRYIGDDIRKGLMKFKLPDTYQTSLGYLPGEIRDKSAWNKYLGYDGSKGQQFSGIIPQGTWRTNPATYPGLQPGSSNRQPGWRFAAAPRQMVNMPAWTPYNVDTTTAGDWKGLLGDWAAPELNTTNLLGVA